MAFPRVGPLQNRAVGSYRFLVHVGSKINYLLYFLFFFDKYVCVHLKIMKIWYCIYFQILCIHIHINTYKCSYIFMCVNRLTNANINSLN